MCGSNSARIPNDNAVCGRCGHPIVLLRKWRGSECCLIHFYFITESAIK